MGIRKTFFFQRFPQAISGGRLRGTLCVSCHSRAVFSRGVRAGYACIFFVFFALFAGNLLGVVAGHFVCFVSFAGMSFSGEAGQGILVFLFRVFRAFRRQSF